MTGGSSDPVAVLRAVLAEEVSGLGAVPLLVALSGGLDSCVLLHALRFAPEPHPHLLAAHFDHRMRRGSAADASWVRGVCRAWEVELLEGRVPAEEAVPASEDEARASRYAFLAKVAAPRGAVILTAHHADDQAETVLFRAFRGTGIEGLAGIPRRRELPVPDGPPVTVARPLLGLTRDELQAYALCRGVPFRHDPSNESPSFARNVIRNTILPLAEREVAPGARRSLARLAEIARDEEEAWSAAMRFVLPALDVRDSSCLREGLLGMERALAARVVRLLAHQEGVTLDHDTTRRALAFVEQSQSGRYIELGRGVELRLEGERVVLSSSGPVADPRRRPPSSGTPPVE